MADPLQFNRPAFEAVTQVLRRGFYWLGGQLIRDGNQVANEASVARFRRSTSEDDSQQVDTSLASRELLQPGHVPSPDWNLLWSDHVDFIRSRESNVTFWTGVEHRNYGVQTKSKLNDLGRADGKTP